MKSSGVPLLYQVCRELVGQSEVIRDGESYSFPLCLKQSGGVWVNITPNTHNPNGKYTRSASLCICDREKGRMLVELQAFESADERVPQEVLVFQSTHATRSQLSPFLEHLDRMVPGNCLHSMHS
ncbi:MAG: hypothetical protein RL536_502 [Candidatus Parcubacteria bacterium]|jgi:hypothetical protein